MKLLWKQVRGHFPPETAVLLSEIMFSYKNPPVILYVKVSYDRSIVSYPAV